MLAQPFGVDQVGEAARMERAPTPVNEAADAVGVALRHMLAAQLGLPARRGRGRLEVEAPGVEHLVERHLAEARGHDLGARVQRVQQRHQPFAFGVVDQIDLVQHDHVAELDLFDQQIDHGAVVLVVARLAAVAQIVGLVEVLREMRGVDHGDDGVEPGQAVQRAAVFVFERECFGDGQRFCHAGRFDQQIVEAPLACQRGDLDQQVLAQRAADAAVGQLDQPLAGLRQHAFADQARIDVDVGQVVDDDRHALAFAVGQHVLQQRGLAGAEEAGQYGDGKTVGHGDLEDGGRGPRRGAQREMPSLLQQGCDCSRNARSRHPCCSRAATPSWCAA